MPEKIRQGDIPGVQLRCRQRLAVPVEEAWPWLTTPGKLGRWLAARAEVDLGAAGGLSLRSVGEDGEPLRERAATVELTAPRRWVLQFKRVGDDWPAVTDLTLELAPAPGGSEISVLQRGFERLPLSRCLTLWEAYRRRWRAALERLASETSGSG